VLGAALLIGQQVAGKAVRDALFLSSFDVSLLPAAAAGAAALSLAAVLAFARAMATASPWKVMPRALSLAAALLVAEWALAFRFPRAAAIAVYLHMSVFGATLVSGFWSLVNERFDPHTAKRVVGAIGAGASLGGIAGGLCTFLLARVARVETPLLAMAAAQALCLASVVRLRPREVEGLAPAAPPAPPSSGLRLLRDVPLLRRLGLLVALAAFVEALLDYVLNAAAAASLATGTSLMSFFALFHTGVGLLSLAVQAALVPAALMRLGLAGTIAVPPALLALTGGFALLVPRLWSVVALRGSQLVLRNSFFRSGYELLYTPLPHDQKRPSKVIVDVGLDRAGTILGSGAVALGLVLLPGRATTAFLALAAVGALAMLALGRRLQRGYVDALVQSLRSGHLRLAEAEAQDATTREAVAAVGRERGEPAPDPPLQEATPIEALADLSCGDVARARAVLRRATELGPAEVACAVSLLGRDDLFGDALWALRKAAPHCTGQLLDVLLDPRAPAVVRRRIPRVLKAAPSPRVRDGLLEGLGDADPDIRFRCAQALVKLKELPVPLAPPEAVVHAAAVREIERAEGVPDLDRVFTILYLALEREPLEIALRALRLGDATLRGTAIEYLENVLPERVRTRLWPFVVGRSSSPPSGRSPAQVRDELLRSTVSVSLRRSAIRRSARPAATDL
jgi:hypothetical protein